MEEGRGRRCKVHRSEFAGAPVFLAVNEKFYVKSLTSSAWLTSVYLQTHTHILSLPLWLLVLRKKASHTVYYSVKTKHETPIHLLRPQTVPGRGSRGAIQTTKAWPPGLGSTPSPSSTHT